MITRRGFLVLAPAALLVAGKAAAPSRYGAIPSARQSRWHEMETTAFLHFTVNTFTGKEWGYGDEDPNLFNPTAFDPDAIVGASPRPACAASSSPANTTMASASGPPPPPATP